MPAQAILNIAEPAQPIPADDEFGRETVPESRLNGLGRLVGRHIGNRTAGTEARRGPWFVTHVVTAFDVRIGPLLRNCMAGLSWRFLCAPVAVRVRQTVYGQLERVYGTELVLLYDLANGLMFRSLARAVVSAPAAAVGTPFNLKMTELNDWLRSSTGRIVSVPVLGMVPWLVAAPLEMKRKS